MDTKNKAIPSEEEFDAAEKEAENAKSVLTVDFGKTITYEEFSASSLTFDFDKLTGADSLAVEHELQTHGYGSAVREFNAEYQIRLACRACTEKVSVGFLLALPIRHTNRIMNSVRNFLLNAESKPETEASGSENKR